MSEQESVRDQEGMVSLIVTMIIMIVLTLIVLGFAQLARREQRQALDRQLSTQAEYAAESGINDADKKISSPTGYYSYKQANNKNTCGDDATAVAADPANAKFNYDLDPQHNVSYSCLLIDQTPDSLSYPDVNTENSTVASVNPLENSAATSISSIKFAWKNPSQTADNNYARTDTKFPEVSTWAKNSPGVLRVDLVPSDSLKRDDLVKNTYTVFFYPSAAGASSISYSSDHTQQGVVQEIKCAPSNPLLCSATITGLPSDTHYYVRIKSLYVTSSATITATTTSGKPARFRGGQYVIDATGKANDVLKRIRVRKSAITSKVHIPDYVLDSGTTICKNMVLSPRVSPENVDNCDAAPPAPATIPSVPATPAPTPSPPTGGGDLTGAANFDSTCTSCNDPPTSGGNGGPATDPYDGNPANQYRWNVYVENHTKADGLTNVTCLWTFSDGFTSNENCQYGQGFQHVFSPRDPTKCMTYSATLVVTFNNGTQSTPWTNTYQLPWNRPPWYTSPC